MGRGPRTAAFLFYWPCEVQGFPLALFLRPRQGRFHRTRPIEYLYKRKNVVRNLVISGGYKFCSRKVPRFLYIFPARCRDFFILFHRPRP